jgi:hypothetical protein
MGRCWRGSQNVDILDLLSPNSAGMPMPCSGKVWFKGEILDLLHRVSVGQSRFMQDNSLRTF